jgi:hypothetical protein
VWKVERRRYRVLRIGLNQIGRYFPAINRIIVGQSSGKQYYSLLLLAEIPEFGRADLAG